MWSVVVTVTASLVPKVEEENGVLSVCCMGGCAHAFSQILEICVTNSEFKTMAYNILAHTLYLLCGCGRHYACHNVHVCTKDLTVTSSLNAEPAGTIYLRVENCPCCSQGESVALN